MDPSGSVVGSRVGHQRTRSDGDDSHRIVPSSARSATVAQPLVSVLKRPSTGHRRVFSQGANFVLSNSSNYGVSGEELKSRNLSESMSSSRGHARTASKTDFILPPGHEERRRSREEANRSASFRSSAPNSPAAFLGRSNHRRNDSLAFSFRGSHSRQASRTDSIYTLRPLTGNQEGRSIGASKVLTFWKRKKRRNNNDDENDNNNNNFSNESNNGNVTNNENNVKGGRRKTYAGERMTRTVVANHCVPPDTRASEHPNAMYADNKVRTTKYTFLSFLPKNLFEQFHRLANLYFLFIVVLNWFPSINAFAKEIALLPILFVLAVTAIKDLFEDRRRRRSDQRVNNSSCKVYDRWSNSYVSRLWKELRVGDIVHLSCDQLIPADVLVLRSSDTDGVCFIDTQNLDGEANLKQRRVPRSFSSSSSDFSASSFNATLECDAPTTKLYRFHGSLIDTSGERVPVSKDNLLLRDSLLKNTDFVEGLVVYAGHESKAMLNNGGPRYKRSQLERQMNEHVVWCVVFLALICFVCSIGSGIWLASFEEDTPFVRLSDTNVLKEAFLAFWTFVIIFQIIIPLSLYVTIEMSKLAQVYFIHQDSLMYDEKSDKSVECRALNIPEELGQIQYVFCDKTGTLTENKMLFLRCTIKGVDYGHTQASNKYSNSECREQGEHREKVAVNESLASQLREGLSAQQFPQKDNAVQDFFLLLAVCNTVIVAKHPHRDTLDLRPPSSKDEGGDNDDEETSNAETETTSRETIRTTKEINYGPEIDIVPPQPQQHNSRLGVVPEELESETSSQNQGPSGPYSITSVGSSSSSLQPSSRSSSSLSGLLTPRRPHRLFDLFPTTSILSPIAASPVATPSSSESPNPRPKNLHLSLLFNPLSKLVSQSSNWSLSKAKDGGSSSLQQEPQLQPIYEAESPDELALVDAAYAYRVKLLKRSTNRITVALPDGDRVSLDLLHVLPFDSNRKRMSVIVRCPLTNEVTLYCKGADSAILSRIKTDSSDLEASVTAKNVVRSTEEHLTAYSKMGLRVLVMAKRRLDSNVYQSWLEQHLHAENALHNRDRLLSDSYNLIERNLSLLGASGIEDKLQERVPETIFSLREAGLVVWVLTGDKQETAINIAYSCRLFGQKAKVLKVNARTRDSADLLLQRYMKEIEEDSRGKNGSELAEMKNNRALVIDGKTLIFVLDRRANLQDDFLKLTSRCGSVLCCRATPLQKAYIVKIVKEKLKMCTLAIGDGANDVSMIQTADVGVGISGQEGMQAVMASDFSIARFKFLQRLLLVHGHWNYDRLARMVLYFFYKNFAFVLVAFWYQLFCGFSGANVVEQMFLMTYNLLFTSVPPVAMGVLDQDIRDVDLMLHPKLYAQGRLSLVYTRSSFFLNMLDGVYQSSILFFLPLLTYYGSEIDVLELGTVMCAACLGAASLHLVVETPSWTIVHWSSVTLSLVCFFLFAILYNGLCVVCFTSANPFWVMQRAMETANFWLIILIAPVLSLLPRLCLRALRNTLRPNAITELKLQQRQVKRSSSTGASPQHVAKSIESTEMAEVVGRGQAS